MQSSLSAAKRDVDTVIVSSPRVLTELELAHRREQNRAIAKRRREATHCKRGHEFNEVNTYRRPDGRRQCVPCHRDAALRYRATTLLRMSVDPTHRFHGTSTGSGIGCDCFPCRVAGAKASRAGYARRHHGA